MPWQICTAVSSVLNFSFEMMLDKTAALSESLIKNKDELCTSYKTLALVVLRTFAEVDSAQT